MTRASGPRFLLLTLALAASVPLLARAQAAGAGQADGGLAAYRAHLENLETVVADCRRQRTADACSASRAGSDDNVQWQSGGAVAVRAIRYDWLREVLSRAGRKEEPQKPAAAQTKDNAEKPVTADDLLAQAQQRLQDDLKQAGGSSVQEPDHAVARKSITEILSRRVYRGVSQTSGWEKFQEWLENLLANIFGHLASFSKAAPWIGRLLEILFIDALGIALVWALVRLERRSRVRLVPDVQPAPNAPSARQWQLWFQDAQQMAAQGLWREAIHFLYWAAISRLESKRMWPADRARTPREYLRLFPSTDPRHDKLNGLTRSFEKTWYGGREAGSADFDTALEMAAGLGVE